MAVTIDRASDQFLLDAYSGAGGFESGGYLIRHPRETDEKYALRQALAVYPNYVRKITDVYGGFLWRAEPAREGPERYAAFTRRADGVGNELTGVLRQYQRLAMVLGSVYVIVDRERGEPATRAEQGLPYLALRLPGEIERTRQDATGRLIEACFREAAPGGGVLYRHFSPEGWALTEDPEGRRMIEAGAYNLGGRLPVVPLHATLPLQPTDLRATPWIHGLAALNWDLYNQRSELRELFRAQTFSILALPIASAEEAQRLKDLTVSTENALTYDPTGGGRPSFIAPPDGPVKLYMEQLAETVKGIYEVANLEFVGGVQQSGVALAFHFQEAERSLGDMASQAERAELQIAALVAAWDGQEWNGSISYARDFALTDLAEDLRIAADSIDLAIGPTFEAELKKDLARKVLGHGTPQATLDQIDRELETAGDPYGDRARREAGTQT